MELMGVACIAQADEIDKIPIRGYETKRLEDKDVIRTHTWRRV